MFRSVTIYTEKYCLENFFFCFFVLQFHFIIMTINEYICTHIIVILCIMFWMFFPIFSSSFFQSKSLLQFDYTEITFLIYIIFIWSLKHENPNQTILTSKYWYAKHITSKYYIFLLFISIIWMLCYQIIF